MALWQRVLFAVSILVVAMYLIDAREAVREVRLKAFFAYVVIAFFAAAAASWLLP